MDQGVLECLKKKYRRRLLQSLLQATEGENTIMDFLKTVNVKDVVYWLADSWNEVKQETLNKSWNKILKTPEETENDSDDEDNLPLSHLIRKLPGCENSNETEVTDWINNDEQHEITDAAIIEMVNEPAEENEEDETEGTVTVPVMTHSEGLAALEAAMCYVEQQPEATATDNLLLRRWRDIAASKRCNVLKQKTLDDFFKV